MEYSLHDGSLVYAGTDIAQVQLLRRGARRLADQFFEEFGSENRPQNRAILRESAVCQFSAPRCCAEVLQPLRILGQKRGPTNTLDPVLAE